MKIIILEQLTFFMVLHFDICIQMTNNELSDLKMVQFCVQCIDFKGI